jgi:hypothetical protein
VPEQRGDRGELEDGCRHEPEDVPLLVHRHEPEVALAGRKRLRFLSDR